MDRPDETKADRPVTLSDGTAADLAGLSPQQLIALQWHEERAFARQILAAAKGSPARAHAIRHAYETVPRIFVRAWPEAGGTLVMGYHRRQGRLVLDLLAAQRRRGLPASLFEIGFAGGVLLKQASDAGFPVGGIEVSPTLHRAAGRLLGPVCEPCLHLGDFLRCELPASQQPLGVVYWNDVFEHIPPDEILDYLRRIHELLIPGGHLVTITPNWHMRPLDITRAVCAPRTQAAGLHLKEYTLREVTRLLRQAGFRRVAMPLCATPRQLVRLGKGLAQAKRLFEPGLEFLPYALARLLCRGLALSTTIGTKSDR